MGAQASLSPERIGEEAAIGGGEVDSKCSSSVLYVAVFVAGLGMNGAKHGRGLLQVLQEEEEREREREGTVVSKSEQSDPKTGQRGASGQRVERGEIGGRGERGARGAVQKNSENKSRNRRLKTEAKKVPNGAERTSEIYKKSAKSYSDFRIDFRIDFLRF